MNIVEVVEAHWVPNDEKEFSLDNLHTRCNRDNSWVTAADPTLTAAL